MASQFQVGKVTAYLASAIAVLQWLPIDSLLMQLEADRQRRAPPELGGWDGLGIPLLKSEYGCYHSSFGEGTAVVGSSDNSAWRRRFPLVEGSLIGAEKCGKVPVSSGPLKAYDIGLRVRFIPKIEWYVVGDIGWIEERLKSCFFLGKKRACGFGKVSRWEITETPEDWSIVTKDNTPARAIPFSCEWPKAMQGKPFNVMQTVPTPPYWENWRAVICAVPKFLGD